MFIMDFINISFIPSHCIIFYVDSQLHFICIFVKVSELASSTVFTITQWRGGFKQEVLSYDDALAPGLA